MAHLPERGQRVVRNAATPEPKTDSPPPPTPGSLTSRQSDRGEAFDQWMRRAMLDQAALLAAELTRKLRQAGVLPEDLHVEYETRGVLAAEPEAAPGPTREERLEQALLNVLHQFHERGHPGYQAIRTGWVPVAKLDEWRKALEQ
jgi:hypothetical protein